MADSDSPEAVALSHESLSFARKRHRSSGSALLHEALASLGIERVASALRVGVAQVERLANPAVRMTLAQQRVLAVAMVVAGQDVPRLRRRATALLAQVAAAERYEARVTLCHSEPPPSNYWPGFNRP